MIKELRRGCKSIYNTGGGKSQTLQRRFLMRETGLWSATFLTWPCPMSQNTAWEESYWAKRLHLSVFLMILMMPMAQLKNLNSSQRQSRG